MLPSCQKEPVPFVREPLFLARSTRSIAVDGVALPRKGERSRSVKYNYVVKSKLFGEHAFAKKSEAAQYFYNCGVGDSIYRVKPEGLKLIHTKNDKDVSNLQSGL